jgi:hypothetical protein
MMVGILLAYWFKRYFKGQLFDLLANPIKVYYNNICRRFRFKYPISFEDRSGLTTCISNHSS